MKLTVRELAPVVPPVSVIHSASARAFQPHPESAVTAIDAPVNVNDPFALPTFLPPAVVVTGPVAALPASVTLDEKLRRVSQ